MGLRDWLHRECRASSARYRKTLLELSAQLEAVEAALRAENELNAKLSALVLGIRDK